MRRQQQHRTRFSSEKTRKLFHLRSICFCFPRLDNPVPYNVSDKVRNCREVLSVRISSLATRQARRVVTWHREVAFHTSKNYGSRQTPNAQVLYRRQWTRCGRLCVRTAAWYTPTALPWHTLHRLTIVSFSIFPCFCVVIHPLGCFQDRYA